MDIAKNARAKRQTIEPILHIPNNLFWTYVCSRETGPHTDITTDITSGNAWPVGCFPPNHQGNFKAQRNTATSGDGA